MNRFEGATDLTQNISAARDALTAGRDLYVSIGQSGPKSTVATPEHRVEGSFYDRSRPIFVQYLNPEVLDFYGWSTSRSPWKILLANALGATRLAFLATDDSLIFPISYVYEIPFFQDFLSEIRPLTNAGYVGYISPFRDVEDYAESKVGEYRNDSINPYYKRAGIGGRPSDLRWVPKTGKSTADGLSEEWHTAFEPDGQLHPLLLHGSSRWGARLTVVERTLVRAPSKLDGRAFLGRFIRNIVPKPLSSSDAALIDGYISQNYLSNYLNAVDANMMYDFSFGDLSCGLASSSSIDAGRLLSARRLERVLQWIGAKDYIFHTATWAEMAELHTLPELSVLVHEIYARRDMITIVMSITRLKSADHLAPATNMDSTKKNIEAIAVELLSNFSP